MSKRLILFGGGGFVGGNLLRHAEMAGWEVLVADSAMEDAAPPNYRKADIGCKEEVEALLSQWKPDAVVNVAAIADIDLAEREKEMAWRVNVTGAINIAESCSRHSAKYVFFSSDAVFSGEDEGYAEESPANPVNYYGVTKAAAEKSILLACPDAVIVRISLVMGFPIQRGNSFFAGLKRTLLRGETVFCSTEEVRTPVDVGTLAQSVLELAENDFSGILHIGSTDSISRYELTKMVAQRMGYPADRILPQTVVPGAGVRARRHRNGTIYVRKAERILKTAMKSVECGLERCFATSDKEM